jgi:hypothetical protein
MNYTDEVPTVSGWYWVKRSNTIADIIQIDAEYPPTYWKTRRERTIAMMATWSDFTEEDVNNLKNKPDSFWLIEYCGPLVPPQ